MTRLEALARKLVEEILDAYNSGVGGHPDEPYAWETAERLIRETVELGAKAAEACDTAKHTGAPCSSCAGAAERIRALMGPR